MGINANPKQSPPLVPWLSIVAFTIAATLFAYPFRNNIFNLADKLLFGVPVLQAVLEGIGVFVAAAIFTRGFRRFWMPATYLGDLPVYSLIIWATPAVILLIMGVKNSTGVNPHLFGFALGASVSVYCLFEETGWRGFLQNATTSLPRWKRCLVVGVIWYIWHTSFLDSSLSMASVITQEKFLLALLAGSYLLGSLVDKTNSVLLAASFHFIINMMAFNRISGITESDSGRLHLMGVIFLVWAPMLVHSHMRRTALQPSKG